MRVLLERWRRKVFQILTPNISIQLNARNHARTRSPQTSFVSPCNIFLSYDRGISHSVPFYVFCLELAPVPEKAPTPHRPPALLSERGKRGKEQEIEKELYVCVRERERERERGGGAKVIELQAPPFSETRNKQGEYSHFQSSATERIR